MEPGEKQDIETVGVSVLAGQLAYLFDDEPALRTASHAELTDRLNHDDRFARARAKYPLDSDDEIRNNRVAEFDDRITTELVVHARAAIRS